MKFERRDLNDCGFIEGVAVVIDVLRAFSTAGYVFTAGAKEILLTDTVESAFTLRERHPGTRIMGEVNGIRVPGFDFGNSPSEFEDIKLHGQTLIHRTTAGTQGVVRSALASKIFAASFCCARATVRAIEALAPSRVSFVVTGGDEDSACADYMQQLFMGQTPDLEHYLQRVRNSGDGKKYAHPNNPDLP